MGRSEINDRKPYIFVSYSHKDSNKVLPVIRKLEDRGVRIWYDEGIEAGTEWPAYIEERLENCDGVIVFLSNNSIESVNCRNEVNVAAELGKEMLVAQIDDDLTYKYGMRLQLGSRQKIFFNRHNTVDSLAGEMLKLKMLSLCTEEESPVQSHPDTKNDTFSENRGSSTKSKAWIIALAALALVAVIALLLVILLQNGEKPADDTAESTAADSTAPLPPEETTSAPEIIEMSDNLLDFIIELEGVVYRLPCAYSTFTDNGWTISSSGYSGDKLIAGASYESYYMSKDGKRILVYSYNMSGNAVKVSDCKIGGVEVYLDDGAALILAKGITPASTVEEIKNAYGAPNDSYTGSSYESLTYCVNESSYNCVKLLCYTDSKESYIKILNFVQTPEDYTVTNTEIPGYLSAYSAPSALGEDVYASVLSIDGVVYKLPSPVSCFIDNGWEIASKPSYVVSGGMDSITLKKDNKELYVRIINYAEYQTTAENCAVYKVEVSAQDGIDIALPGIGKPISIGMPGSDLVPLLPETFDLTEGSTYNYYNYYEYRERTYSITVTIDNATGSVYMISLSCETWIH